MRFISFDKQGSEAVGVQLGDDVVDLSIAAPELPGTLAGLIAAAALDKAHAAAESAGSDARRTLADIRHLPLIPRPSKIFGVGRNYRSHVGERPATPGFFISSASRLCAHEQPMIVPRICRTLDFEVELAIVIGIGGKYVAAKDALRHVAGYTVVNDGSVRALMSGPTSLSLMKNCDKTLPLGPALVTPEELPEAGDGLVITSRRNGETVQRDTTDNMFWKIPEILEMVFRYQTMEPGDVICTGSCGGTVVDTHRGVPMDDPSLPYLRDGEVIESEVEGVGLLRNPIVEEP